MSGRHAILIGNSVSYGVKSRDVTPSMVKSVLAELQGNLLNLGEYTFDRVTTLLDRTADGARTEIRKAIRTASKTGDTLLLYYFGHGVIHPQRDELYLYFKDSDDSELPSMLPFADIVHIFDGYPVPKVVAMLDCCHAAMVSRQLRVLDNLNAKYFLMASVTPKGKASVDYEGATHIGLFTRFLLDAFKNPAVHEPHSRDVTFRGFYSYVEAAVKQASKQEPYPSDNGLGMSVFFKQATEPAIPKQFNIFLSKKCSYGRIFVLCSFLLARQFDSEESLYKLISTRKPREFLQPRKTGPRQIEYICISAHAFSAFLRNLRWIGVLRRGTPVELTDEGKRMARGDGRLFNSQLYELIMAVWGEHGLKLSDLEDAITMRIRTSRVPSMEGIYRDLRLTRRLLLPVQAFKFLIDLTGYVGALNYATERTFFLSVPEESKAYGT